MRSSFSPEAEKKEDFPIPPASPKPFFRSIGRLPLLCGLLSALVIGVFWPSIHCQFQYYDENNYLVDNDHVNHGFTWNGIHWAFTALDRSNWVPLTWLTHMLDFQVYDYYEPWGHHLTNVLFHAANVSLLFLLLQRMTGAVGRSFIVAALFAIHPLRVESVTWISERKDVVSFFFGMLAFLAYVRYAEESKKTSGRQDRFYLLTLLFFVFSLMGKATLVTFPCLLLLLDYWPLGRMQNFKLDRSNLLLLVEKIPFFLLIVPISIVAKLAEQAGHSILLHPPLVLRLQTALISYLRYLEYMFWPVNLSSNYPYPNSWPTAESWLAAAVLLGLSILALVMRARRPYFLIGWLWYVGTLVPVNGILEQIGSPVMADRYTYIPMIGILLIVVWGVADLAKFLRLRLALLVMGSLVSLLLIAVTRHDIAYWKDDDSRWSHAAAVTRNNWTAYANLGVVVSTTDPDRALDCFEKSVEIYPGYVESQLGLANSLSLHKRYPEAIEHYRIAWALDTDDPRTQFFWSEACSSERLPNEAIYHMQIAHVIDPDKTIFMESLARLLIQEQRISEAIPLLKNLCAIQTGNAENFDMLGHCLLKNGQLDGAIQAFQASLSLASNTLAAKQSLASAIRLKQQQAIMHSATNGAAMAQPPAFNPK